MKKITLCSALALTVFAASCSKEAAGPVPAAAPGQGKGMVEMTFSATRESSTKAVIDGLDILWQEGDQIAVYDNANPAEANIFTCTSNGKEAWFTGTVHEGATEYYALSPASAANGVSTKTTAATETEPESYEVTAINAITESVQLIPSGGNVDPKALVSYAVTSSNSLTFVNAVAVAKITVSEPGITRITFRGNASENIWGGYSINHNTAATSISSAVNCGSVVSVATESGEPFAAGDYYVPLYPQTLGKGITVNLSAGSSAAVKTTSNPIQFVRNGCWRLGDVTAGLEWKERPLQIANAQDLVNWAVNAASYTADDEVVLTNDIDLSGVDVPSAPSFAGILNGDGHSLKNWTPTRPLIVDLNANAAVTALKIDASCNLLFPKGYGSFGFLVANNYGSLVEVTNNADAYFAEYCTPEGQDAHYGILVGYSWLNTTIENCINNGNVYFEGSRSDTDRSMYFGTIAGTLRATETTPSYFSSCKNCGEIKFTVAEDKAAYSWHIGGIAGACQQYAQCLGCSNEGPITFTTPACPGLISCAGLVSYCAGECVGGLNEKDITVACETSEGMSDGTFAGVVVAGIAGYLSQKATGCENKGLMTFRASNTAAAPRSLGGVKGGSVALGVAGIIGYASGNGQVIDCNNYGGISASMTAIENCYPQSSIVARYNCCGIIAASANNVQNCHNYGEVIATFVSSDRSAASTGSVVSNVAGISGGDYHYSGSNRSNIKDCFNHADISCTNDCKQYNSSLGGIVAWHIVENASGTKTISNCTNEGAVTFDGKGMVRMGGISGNTSNIDKCVNRGKIWLKDGVTGCCIGGILGFFNFHKVTDCENYGMVQCDVNVGGALQTDHYSNQSGQGGICGGVGNTDVVFTGNKSICELKAFSGSKHASLLIGTIDRDKQAAIGKSFNVGTPESPCIIGGKVNATTVTESNYTNYMHAYNNGYLGLNPNVVFNVQYGTN